MTARVNVSGKSYNAVMCPICMKLSFYIRNHFYKYHREIFNSMKTNGLMDKLVQQARRLP